ncbi:NAD-dependent epimerase/dehydratase family protein [Candidatus Pelagibacter ubique]|nr:NAD-dependent epimerase/dehydratase family protein [Candidatus Pelagibacter ubique]
MKIIVTGGDGYCGWPISTTLASSGHNILILDNFSRRKIDRKFNLSPLNKIYSLKVRVESFNRLKLKKGKIDYKKIDLLKNLTKLKDILKKFKPDCIIHLAHQRSAPFSMLNLNTNTYTVDNNVSALNNLLATLVDLKTFPKIIHLGTMGVYGYDQRFGKIPEGYLDVKINQTRKNAKILFPTNPGSIYHLTKSMNQLILSFYKKNWNKFDITDLHQGIVWGFVNDLVNKDKRLINRFDYDGEYGTVLNRFIVQAIYHEHMTIYGTGEQTRAFIHIDDTCECINLALNDTKRSGSVKIFNQIGDVKSLNEIAKMVKNLTGAKIKNIKNPRKELSKNDLFVTNLGFKKLGFKPIKITEERIMSILRDVKKYKYNFNSKIISSKALW